ncbi:hypothetical protein GQ53DRAFT_662530, partial [Thozetella sp. PMI_491]
MIPKVASLTRFAGCVICKARKVKCDETPSGCVKCQKLGLQCPGLNLQQTLTQSEIDRIVHRAYQEAGRAKRPTHGSCHHCRAAKARCSQTKPSCARCQQKNLHCAYRGESPLRPSGSAALRQMSPVSDSPAQSPISSRSVATFSPLSPTGLLEPSRTNPDDGLWLFSNSIPTESGRLREVARCYFERVHAVHCFNFLHRPSFTKALDTGNVRRTYGAALLHIICAFGAMFVLSMRGLEIPPRGLPGRAWASKTQTILFQDPGHISIHSLMATVLLWEYQCRYGSSTAAMMISSCCARAAQLLRLDVDQTPDSLSNDSPQCITIIESRRRLFWACWRMDSIIAAGVDRYMALSRSIPDVPLPCRESDFIYQLGSPTEKLVPDGSWSASSTGAVTNVFYQPDLEASYIRILYLRSLTLRCIRDASPSPLPWEPGSAFRRLTEQFKQWENDLPRHLQPTEQNAYIHRDQRRLAMWLALHVIYHVCHSDLFRVMLPGYHFPINQVLGSHAPAEFVAFSHNECRVHAGRISDLLALGHRLGGPAAFDDSMCVAAAYESTRIQ